MVKMSRRSVVEPVWLDRMLQGWGTSSLKSKGWYAVNPMLKDGIPVSARSYEPTGLCLMDYTQLEEALETLDLKHRCAITRAYKPWTAKAMEAEWPATSTMTWCNWLHAAAKLITIHMNSYTEAKKHVDEMITFY